MSVSREDLGWLARKYEALGELRRARENAIAEGTSAFSGDAAEARRVAMRTVAAEFPGALRELDALSAEALVARGDAVKRALAGGATEPWMRVCVVFHRLASEALANRRDGDRARPESGRVMTEVWVQVGHAVGLTPREAEACVFGG